MLGHPNPIARATGAQWGQQDSLIWGIALKRRLSNAFRKSRRIAFEIFNDWLPIDDCCVSLDPQVRDRWGDPVVRVRLGYHEHNLKISHALKSRAERVLQQMGARNVGTSITGAPPPDLVAGGCRFGTDPATSVLDPDGRAHEVDNLYVGDTGFMPTGGSVPYTWTIYANALRVAARV